jgi:cell division protein FtsI/penicillin-binding protein 2
MGAVAGIGTRAFGNIDAFPDPSHGCAVLLDVRSRKLTTSSSAVAGGTLVAPGSTLKPLVLAALLKRGKLKPDTAFPCPTRLTIGTRRFDCTHPLLPIPVRADTALAYSCNCFVAHVAEWFAPGELSRELEGLGLASRTGLSNGEAAGRVAAAATLDSVRMQALGEAGILVTPLELALAYRQLAREIDAPEMQPILAGLEGAVEFGTARGARLAGATLAGKTGTTRSPTGDHIAWFAGFVPSRSPETVVAVMLTGRSGGADAAPVAARILEAYRSGRV